jgi:thiamine biosynthesis lipoprotein
VTTAARDAFPAAPSQERRVLLPVKIHEPAALPNDARLFAAAGLSMGTTWRVKAIVSAGQADSDITVGIQAQLSQVVAQMSPWEMNSDLMRFNRATAGTWISVPADFYQVLDHALLVAEQSDGAYDPSIGQLANVWGFGPRGGHASIPPEDELNAALRYTGWRKINIDRSGKRVYQAGNIHIDLCSTAKGYGVDQVARYLEHKGIHSYLVEVGGELRGLGIKPDGQPWWVEMENPPSSLDGINTIVALHGLSIATSGDYRRSFEHNGTLYSHTIDPRTGFPVRNGLASVTVLHRECMIADALATAMMVLGPEAGMDYAKKIKCAARFVVRLEEGYREYWTPALWAMLD